MTKRSAIIVNSLETETVRLVRFLASVRLAVSGASKSIGKNLEAINVKVFSDTVRMVFYIR